MLDSTEHDTLTASTIVGILTFMSRINFMLSWVEYEKKFFNLDAWSNPDVNFCWLFMKDKKSSVFYD